MNGVTDVVLDDYRNESRLQYARRLVGRPDFVTVAEWFLVSNRRRKRLAMLVGGVKEVIQETALALLIKGASPKYQFTTIVTNKTRWTLFAMVTKKLNSTEMRLSRVTRIQRNVTFDFVKDVFDKEMAVALRDYIEECLPERYVTLIHERFVESRTFEEIGRRLKVTKERVRQMELKALRMMVEKSEDRPLTAFLWDYVEPEPAPPKKDIFRELAQSAAAF